MRSTLTYNFCIFLILFGISYVTGYLNTILEGFANPFDDMLRQLQQSQDSTSAYDKWVGHVYKYAPENSNILNDFKARVFQPDCKFQKKWATKLPKGMNIPTPANNATTANIAYKTYMTCLSNGNKKCLEQLENARTRFMEPGCQFLSPQDSKSYSRDYRVSIK